MFQGTCSYARRRLTIQFNEEIEKFQYYLRIIYLLCLTEKNIRHCIQFSFQEINYLPFRGKDPNIFEPVEHSENGHF